MASIRIIIRRCMRTDKKRGWDKKHPLKLKKDWNLSFFSNSSPFTSRKIKLQLYAAYIFLNLLQLKPNPFLFLL